MAKQLTKKQLQAIIDNPIMPDFAKNDAKAKIDAGDYSDAPKKEVNIFETGSQAAKRLRDEKKKEEAKKDAAFKKKQEALAKKRESLSTSKFKKGDKVSAIIDVFEKGKSSAKKEKVTGVVSDVEYRPVMKKNMITVVLDEDSKHLQSSPTIWMSEQDLSLIEPEETQKEYKTDAEFLEAYNKLQKGDEVLLTYDSIMGTPKKDAKFFISKGDTKIGKMGYQRMILKDPENPKGIKLYLYKRRDKVSLAKGDMGLLLKSIKIIGEKSSPAKKSSKPKFNQGDSVLLNIKPSKSKKWIDLASSKPNKEIEVRGKVTLVEPDRIDGKILYTVRFDEEFKDVNAAGSAWVSEDKLSPAKKEDFSKKIMVGKGSAHYVVSTGMLKSDKGYKIGDKVILQEDITAKDIYDGVKREPVYLVVRTGKKVNIPRSWSVRDTLKRESMVDSEGNLLDGVNLMNVSDLRLRESIKSKAKDVKNDKGKVVKWISWQSLENDKTKQTESKETKKSVEEYRKRLEPHPDDDPAAARVKKMLRDYEKIKDKRTEEKIIDCKKALEDAQYKVMKKSTPSGRKQVRVKRQDRTILTTKMDSVFKTIEKDVPKKDGKAPKELVDSLGKISGILTKVVQSLDKLAKEGDVDKIKKVLKLLEELN